MNKRYAFLMNADKCIGCRGCAMACKNFNRLEPSMVWRQVYPLAESIYPHRERAFYLSMKAHGLPIDDRLIVHTSFYGSGVAGDLPALLELGATAILCGNDPIAYEVIHECLKAGYRIPEDVSVIGFDDLPDSAKTTPPLTTIRQNRLDLGKCSYSTLCSLLMHVTCSMTLLRPRLVVRESTGEAATSTK